MPVFRSAVLTLCLFPVAAAAQSLTGIVVDRNGVGIDGVSVSLNNVATPQVTAGGGVFAFAALQNRTYTMTVLPPAQQWAPRQLSVTVNLATSIGNVALQDGAPLTAVVVGSNGLPLPGANLDALLPDGTLIYTPGDGADATGLINVTVPLGPVHIEINPASGQVVVPFAGDFEVTGPLGLGTVVLPTAHAVTGTVIDAITSLPISAVRVTPFDNITGIEVPQVTSVSTSATGAFTVRLPIGVHRLEFDPPTTRAFAGYQRHGVFVPGPTALGFVRLKQAITVTGTVQGPTGPVRNADIDLDTVDGYKMFTLHDNTDANGNFSVKVPAGSYRVRVDPVPGTGLVGTRTALQTFAASAATPPIALSAGVSLQLLLQGPGGPEANADIDFFDPVTHEPIILSGDKTDAAGRMDATVPTGLFDIALDGAQGSLMQSVRAQLPIFGPLAGALTLGPKLLLLDLRAVYGIQTTVPGAPLFVDAHIRNLTTGTLAIDLELLLRTPAGTETQLVAIPGDLPAGLDLPLPGLVLPAPPVASGDLGHEVRLYLRARDRATGFVLDQAYVEYVIE